MSIITLTNTKHFDKVALAAAGVKQHHWYAVLFKISMDDTCRPFLRKKLKTHALYLRSKKKWNITRVRLFDLVELSLAELRNPFQGDDKDVIRAQALGVGEAKFYKSYKKFYDEIYAEVNEWASRGESRIKAQYNIEDLYEAIRDQSYDSEHGYVADPDDSLTPQEQVEKDYNG